MNIDELLTITRSARKTLDLGAPVDLAEVRECLGIGLQAANGSNSQSWRWIVVSDPDLRAQVAAVYREAYLALTGGRYLSDKVTIDDAPGRMTTSTEWLVEHLAEVALLVIPCYEQYMRRTPDDESFQAATLYGSISPPVYNFRLASHSRGYGTCITRCASTARPRCAPSSGSPRATSRGASSRWPG